MNKAVHDALARLDRQLKHSRLTEDALRDLTGLMELNDPIYDPVQDCFAVRIPGELARRLRALADTA